jgi:hypothetical protein
VARLKADLARRMHILEPQRRQQPSSTSQDWRRDVLIFSSAGGIYGTTNPSYAMSHEFNTTGGCCTQSLISMSSKKTLFFETFQSGKWI